MRVGRASIRRVLVAAALCGAVTGAPPSKAEEAAPPTVERIQLDETAGHVEEALEGWAARYLRVTAPADRTQAMQRYVALASKNGIDGDPWLVDSVQRSGPGIRIVAGRRVVAVIYKEYLGDADANRVAALFDAYELAVERMTGTRPPVSVQTKDDNRPRDRAGRFLVAVGPLPGAPAATLAEQAFEAWIAAPDEKSRGPALAFAVGGSCVAASIAAAPNHRARLFDPAISHVVRDLAARETGDPASIAAADAWKAAAKEIYESDWAPGCIQGEWIGSDEALAQLFFLGLDAERAANRPPFDALRAFLTEPRRDTAWDGGRVVGPRDFALEPLAATCGPGFADVFRRAGVLPVGLAFESLKHRVAAEEMCRDAETLRWDDATRGAAARQFRRAAETLAGEIAADEAVVEALELEEKDDPKKARVAAQKLGLVEGFDFLGPLPETRRKDEHSAAARLMPLAVATASARHPLKVKEPVEVSLKWDEVKDPYDRLVQHTPWGDKKGITWGGSVVVATKWGKDLGRWLRLRPCRGEYVAVVALADGRPLDAWPDGSVIVPGAKGTEIVFASPARITCSVPWRDGRSIDADLAAAAAGKDAVLALRPWAARRVTAALPAIVAALTQLSDAEILGHLKLLAPYRGGDAATCDAMLAHGKSRPAVLAAYLDVCRGTRDPAVIDRLVGLATAPEALPETVTRVQYVLDGALFRKVTEKAAALPALWERGRKWMASAAFAEAEEIRDLHDVTPCFRVLADPAAWGRACLAPARGSTSRGEGYLCLDVPEASGTAWITVRWQPVDNGRLTLRGYVTDGKKTKPFSLDVPAPSTPKPEWGFDVFELGPIPRGRIVVAFDDPCASGCRIDAVAVGPKPLE